MKESEIFQQIMDRRGTASVKWDEADQLFGGKDLLPMWVADMVFPAPVQVTEALRKRVEHAIYGYTFRSDNYLKSVQRWMQSRQNWSIETEWICHSPGVVTALNLIVDGFTEPDDKILIQPPVYPPFRKSAENQNRDLVTSPLIYEQGTYRMDFKDLDRKLADPRVRLMILCSPHNPAGRVWTEEELRTLAELTQRHDVLVVSDEIHGDLILDHRRHLPFASLSADAAARSIVCTAPSKTFNLAGLQMSNIIIANEKLRKTYLHQLRRFSLNEPTSLGVVAAEAAYTYGAEWLDQCIAYIQGNRDFVRRYLETQIPQLVLTPLEGTYLGWIDCRALEMTNTALQDLMVHQAHLAVNPGHTFGKEGSGFIRINIACSRELVKKAMDRLFQAMTSIEKL
ncbi:MAG: MalY/PatB family protein [Sporolactobacillus sp.]